jgi:hypothetical protein
MFDIGWSEFLVIAVVVIVVVGPKDLLRLPAQLWPLAHYWPRVLICSAASVTAQIPTLGPYIAKRSEFLWKRRNKMCLTRVS